MNWIGWIIQWLSPEWISAFEQIDPYISKPLVAGMLEPNPASKQAPSEQLNELSELFNDSFQNESV